MILLYNSYTGSFKISGKYLFFNIQVKISQKVLINIRAKIIYKGATTEDGFQMIFSKPLQINTSNFGFLLNLIFWIYQFVQKLLHCTWVGESDVKSTKILYLLYFKILEIMLVKFNLFYDKKDTVGPVR